MVPAGHDPLDTGHYCERRKAHRVRTLLPLELDDGRTHAFACCTTLSLEGMFVRTDRPNRVSTSVRVRLGLPGEPDPISLDGHVVTSIPGRGLVLRFLPAAGFLPRLETYIDWCLHSLAQPILGSQRRQRRRIHAGFRVRFGQTDLESSGLLIDLSPLSGYILSADSCAVGSRIRLDLELPRGGQMDTVHLTGKVVRRDPPGSAKMSGPQGGFAFVTNDESLLREAVREILPE